MSYDSSSMAADPPDDADADTAPSFCASELPVASLTARAARFAASLRECSCSESSSRPLLSSGMTVGQTSSMSGRVASSTAQASSAILPSVRAWGAIEGSAIVPAVALSTSTSRVRRGKCCSARLPPTATATAPFVIPDPEPEPPRPACPPRDLPLPAPEERRPLVDGAFTLATREPDGTAAETIPLLRLGDARPPGVSAPPAIGVDPPLAPVPGTVCDLGDFLIFSPRRRRRTLSMTVLRVPSITRPRWRSSCRSCRTGSLEYSGSLASSSSAGMPGFDSGLGRHRCCRSRGSSSTWSLAPLAPLAPLVPPAKAPGGRGAGGYMAG